MDKLYFFIIISVISLQSVSSQQNGDENDGKRLIKTSKDDPGTWMTEEEIWQLKVENVGFFDITGFNYSAATVRTPATLAIPTMLRFESTVQDLISKIDIKKVEEFLVHISSYLNRFFRSPSGRESQEWLLAQVLQLIENYAGNAMAYQIEHDNFDQKSVIVQLQGADETLKDEVIIIGAHFDSIAGPKPENKAPGADDDGTGSATVFETLRVIVEAGIILKRTVEFHWYAAEEVGLIGSQAIALVYGVQNINVVGMLNLDCVGYHEVDEVAFLTDNVDPDLTQFLRILTAGYLTYGSRDSVCGYACSDHASWNENGYPCASAEEAVLYDNHHTELDTIDIVDFNQVNEYIKLAIGFAIEYGEPMI